MSFLISKAYIFDDVIAAMLVLISIEDIVLQIFLELYHEIGITRV